eukprot:scaffold174_cov98-Cylindrotheca_fusiformis.AAC.1
MEDQQHEPLLLESQKDAVVEHASQEEADKQHRTFQPMFLESREDTERVRKSRTRAVAVLASGVVSIMSVAAVALTADSQADKSIPVVMSSWEQADCRDFPWDGGSYGEDDNSTYGNCLIHNGTVDMRICASEHVCDVFTADGYLNLRLLCGYVHWTEQCGGVYDACERR